MASLPFEPQDTSPDSRSHFGLAEWPFTSEISVTKMWRHPGLDDLVDDLEETVSTRMSAAVIAPSGAGKAALLRRLVERLPDTRYKVADVKVTSVGNRDFYRGLARALGIEPAGTWPRLLEKLQDYAHPPQSRPAGMVDDPTEHELSGHRELLGLTDFGLISRDHDNHGPGNLRTSKLSHLSRAWHLPLEDGWHFFLSFCWLNREQRNLTKVAAGRVGFNVL